MLKQLALCVIPVAFMLSLPSTTVGLDIVLSDFETGLDGWVPNNWDSPPTWLFADQNKGVTLGKKSLMVIVPRSGWTIAALVKFQDLYKNDPVALADLKAKWMVAKTLECDITIDPGNWLGRSNPEEWVNISLLSNSQNGGWANLPVISDSVNPNSPGGWDPVNFPKRQTRHIVYDLSAVNAAMKAAGGPGDWFEVFAIVNSAGYPKGGPFWLDNVKLVGIPDITWVSFHGTDAATANAATAGFIDAPDKGYTDLLKANGYNVTRYLQTGTPDANVLNAADLVIVSRSVASGSFNTAAATRWNTQITAPMIVTNGYLTRKSRLGLMTGSTIPDSTGDIKLTAADPKHPIFAGISLTGGTMDANFAGICLYPDGVTVARGISIITEPADAEATVLATVSQASAATGPVGAVMIAEYPAGATVEHDGPATDVLAGPRLIFLTGSREASGKNSEGTGMIDLTADGQKVFLNAVNYMLNPPKKINIELVNPSFEEPNVGKIKGWNGEGVGGTPAVDIPGWASDGAPVDSGIEQGWGATNGTWTAFMKAKDPMVWQLTDYVIQAGDVFTLKVDARITWAATNMMMILYYDEQGLALPVATNDATLTDAMATYSLKFAADDAPDCVGKRVGVSFANSSAVADSWIGLDNVRLSVTLAK